MTSPGSVTDPPLLSYPAGPATATACPGRGRDGRVPSPGASFPGLRPLTAPVIYSIDGTEYVLVTVGGAALTASEELGKIGARVIAFKLGGKKLPTGPQLEG